MLRIPHLLLLSPCWISLFSIVPELLCQLRFGFLGTAFGKAICHTLLYVCLFAVCARPDMGQSPRASAGQLLHSSCDGTYNFLYVCALCAYDMCDTLVLKFIMWPRQTRKQDNTTGQSRAEQNRATCNAITDIEIPMSAVTNSHTHTHTSNADNTSRYWVSERERGRACECPLAVLFMAGNIGACAVCVLGIWKSESIAIFFSMTQFELIFLKWASERVMRTAYAADYSQMIYGSKPII